MAEGAGGLSVALAPGQELAALFAITRVLAGTLDPPAVAAAILEGAETLVGECAGFLWELGPEGEDFRVVAVRGFRQSGRPLPRLRLGHGLTGLAAARREPAVSVDLCDDPRVSGRDWLAAEGLVSGIVLPLIHAGTLHGTLNLFTRTRHEFPPEEVRLLEAFATQAGAAIANARLYAQSERRRRAAEAVGAVGRLVAESLDPDEVARRVADSVLTLLDAKASVLYRMDPATGDLVAVATAGDHGPLGNQALVLPRGTGISGVAVQLGRPVTSPDLLGDPRLRQAPAVRARIAHAPFGAALSVPLSVRDRVIGALAVGDVLGRVFDEDDVRLVQTLADQAALALENARLFTETTRRRRQADELARVARTVTESLDVATVGAGIVESVRALLGVEASTVRLLEPDGWLALVAHAGPTPYLGPGHRLPPGVGVAGRAVADGHPVVTRDLLSDPDIRLNDDLQTYVVTHGYRAMVAVPLRVKGRIVGTLSVSTRSVRDFVADELALLEVFADQAALALENARLFAEAEARRASAETLAEVGRGITRTLDVAEVARRITEGVCRLLRGLNATVSRLDPTADELIVVGSFGDMGPGFALGSARPRSTGMSGLAILGRRAVVTSDLLADPRLVHTPEDRARVSRARYRAVLSVPLLVHGRVIGALSVADAAARVFTDEDVRLAEAFADQAALALENARLYEEAEQGRREAAVLAELARAVSASLDLDTVLQRVAEGARELCGSDAAAIGLVDGAGAAVVRYLSGFQGEETRHLRVEPDRGVGGQVLRTGRPFRTDDYAADPRITRDYEDVVVSERLVAQLCVPVRIGERVEALLYVSNRARRPFTERDETVLLRLAEQAAVAIHNARLYARQQAARADAEESGRRFRDLVQGLDAIVWECDAETWRCTFVSQRAEALLGYPVARWLDEPAFRARLVHPEDRERVMALGRAAVAQGRDDEYEYRAITADGRVVWLRETLHVVASPDGGHRRLRGLTIDLTARRHAEAALRESEQRFRALSTSSPVGIFLTDVEGRCTYTNPRCRAICGFAFDETLEASWARHLHAEDRDRVLRQWAAATSAGRGYSDEFRFVVHGVLRSVHVRSAPMVADTGALLGHVGTVEDVGERKRAAETRRVLLGRVIAAQEDERGRIARELHDETAQSLASLVIGLSALQQERTLRGVRARLIELHALAGSALGEVRRLAQGLRPSVLSLLGLVPALERHAEEFGRLHQIAVGVRVDGLDRGRLPPATETALYRIVQEALANVARHAGARSVTIVLGCDRRGVSLTVTDDGRGFDVQGARTGPADFTHLGLENMRERAAALNGELTVESAPGRGTTVRATVPLPAGSDGTQDPDPPRG